LIYYNDSIFKKGKENTQIRKKLLKEFQDEYLIYPKKIKFVETLAPNL
jgi:hypothetical protein